MRDIFKKIKENKKSILSIFLFAIIGVFAVANVSQAVELGQAVINAGKLIVGSTILIPLGAVAALIVLLMGWINSMVIGTLTAIAQYNQFVSEPSITDAWVVVRDLCNMFFILILLVIAFGTILRIESYNAKKLLPKLLIMAVLINFSKMIFGLVIDFSQVIMLTFVNAWGPNSSFVVITRMQDFFSIKLDSVYSMKTIAGDQEINLMEIVAGMLLGILFMIISGIVLVVLLATLVMRIVMIWIYIILSPFVFLGAAFTPMQKFTSKIWEDFIKQVIGGPVLAFFIWLSLISVDGVGKSMTTAVNNQCFGNTTIGCMNDLIPFIISIGMLIGGLMVAQQIGGAAGSMAGKGMAWAKRAPMLVGGGAMFGAGYGARKFAGWDGKVFGKKIPGVAGFEIRPSKILEGVKEHWAQTKVKDEMKARDRGSELLGKGGLRGLLGGGGVGADWASQYVTGFANLKGFKNMAHDVRWGSRSRGKLQEQYTETEKELKPLQDQLKFIKENSQSKEEKEEKIKRREEIIKRTDSIRTQINSEEDDKKIKKMKSELEGLEGSIEGLEKGINIPVEHDNFRQAREQIEKEIGDVNIKLKPIKDQIAYAQPPKAFEARAAYRTLVNSEKAKVKDVKNADELLMYYKDAERKNEKYRMAAIAERLYEDTNGNELLNEYNLPSGGIGLHRFIKEKVVEPGYMSEREGLRLQDDLSQTAEKVGHWDMAKTVGVNQFGELVSLIKEIKGSDGKVTGYDDSLHARAAAAEIFKMDPQGIMRSLNRLAFGGETPDGKGGREFNISTLGKVLTKALTSVFKDHGTRLLTNTAFNLSKPNVVKEMQRIGVADSTINVIQEKGQQEGHTKDPNSVLEELKRMNEHITKAENT